VVGTYKGLRVSQAEIKGRAGSWSSCHLRFTDNLRVTEKGLGWGPIGSGFGQALMVCGGGWQLVTASDG
jgi:hypothetical protein